MIYTFYRGQNACCVHVKMLRDALNREFFNVSVLLQHIADSITSKSDNAKFNSRASNLRVGVLIKLMADQIVVAFAEYMNYFAMQNKFCASSR